MDRKRRDSPFFDFSFRIRGKIRWRRDRLLFFRWTHDFIQILPIEKRILRFSTANQFRTNGEKIFLCQFLLQTLCIDEASNHRTFVLSFPFGSKFTLAS